MDKNNIRLDMKGSAWNIRMPTCQVDLLVRTDN
jgi:hypothetical protein